jgi:hypothetical protein
MRSRFDTSLSDFPRRMCSRWNATTYPKRYSTYAFTDAYEIRGFYVEKLYVSQVSRISFATLLPALVCAPLDAF